MHKEEHNAYCKGIVSDLKLTASGEAVKCPGCYEVFSIAEAERSEINDEECVVCPHCGQHHDPNDLEDYGLYDYFFDESGVLDYDWILDSQMRYKAVRIMVAWGGPNVYINTWENRVELYWWTESGEAYIPYELNQQIDEIWEEYFQCVAPEGLA